MIGRELVNIMLKDGVVIPFQHNVEEDIQKSITDKHIQFIEKDGHTIGFATYKDKNGKLLLHYCFIYKKFRDKGNLLHFRKLFRSLHDGEFYWRNRRRNKVYRTT